MLIEFHIIQNHAPSNLNRDDTGSPKSCIFGGVRRSRISSQCLKRSIRQSQIFKNGTEDLGKSYRTRKLPELVKKELITTGVSEEYALSAALILSGIGKKKKSESGEVITPQIMFFSDKEIQNIVDILREEINSSDSVESFSKMKNDELVKIISKRKIQPITPDMALFGRMITSNAFTRIDASIQVAHAISTHKIESEFDYFTAVDDLAATGGNMEEQGAGMIGDVEFNSACYYKYFSLDTNGFKDNIINNDENLKDKGIEILKKTALAFLEAAVKVTPTGKQNTFAAHQLPEAILVEIKDENIPVSYANAFVKPCRPHGDVDLLEDSIEKFVAYTNLVNRKYALKPKTRLWFTLRDVNERNIINDSTVCETLDDVLNGLGKSIENGSE